MVKLRKAFSLNIHLHIRQGMLQRLWDKYVPADSSEYGQIELIYLGEQARGGRAQAQQADLSISIVLKNKIMQMGLEKCPVKTAYVREQMENSLQRMGRFYLTQLKCCNFVMYRKAERFLTLLNQVQTGRDRYLKWQKDSGYMKEQRENFRVFSRFAVNIREFLTEHSERTMRAQERELLHLLSKKEYRKFCQLCRLENELGTADVQSVKWKKNREKMLHSIEGLETVKIRRLWGQMERLVSEGVNQDTVLMHKLTQIHEQYSREIVRGFWGHVLSVLDSGEFQAASDMAKVSQAELRKQLAGESPVQTSERKTEYASEEKSAYLSESNSVESLERKTEYASEESAYLSGRAVSEFLRHIEAVLEMQKSRIVQQESKMFASYREIYQEAFASVWRQGHLEEKAARKIVARYHQLQGEKKEEFVEELAKRILLRRQAYSSKEEDSGGSFDYTGREIDGLISYIAYVIEKKSRREAGVTEETTEKTHTRITETEEETLAHITETEEEMLAHITETEEETLAHITETEGETLAHITGTEEETFAHITETEEETLAHITETEEREVEELFMEIASVIEKKTSVNTDIYKLEEVEEILSYIDKGEEQKFSEAAQTVFAVTEKMHHSVDGQEERKMLLYLRNMEEEKRTEFVQTLADTILLHRQNYVTEGRNYRKIVDAKEEISYRTLESKEENARIFGYTEEQIEGLLSYVSYVAQNKIKAGEIISKESEATVRRAEEAYTTEETYVVEEAHTTEEIRETELAVREAEELFIQMASVIKKKTSLTERYAKTEVEEIRRMFMYLHNMEEERRTEFIEKLAEKLLRRQQTHVTEERNSQRIVNTQEESSHRTVESTEESSHRTMESTEEFSHRTVESTEKHAGMFGYTEEQIEDLLSYVSYVIENKKKAGEFIFQEGGTADRKTEEARMLEEANTTEEIRETKFAMRETEELFLQIKSVIENKTLLLNTAGHEEKEVEGIRQMLLYLHDMEEERRTEFIEKLAGRMMQQLCVTEEKNLHKTVDIQEEFSNKIVNTQEEFVHRIADAFAEEFAEREAEKLYVQLFSVMEEKKQADSQRGITGRQDILPSVSAPYEKLWEWGKALLFYPEQDKALQEADILPAGELDASGERMTGRDTASYGSEDRDEIQTEIIRRQIEAAKDRNTLLQLIYQINHRIAMTQEEEKEEPEEKLIYADSQLNLPEMKSLLKFVKELDEGQYGKLVEELSEVTKLQWQLHLQGAEEVEIEQIKRSAAEQKDKEGKILQSARTPGRLENHYLTVAYPALVYQIEEFEKHRQREVQGKIRSLGRNYLRQMGYLPGETIVLENGQLSEAETTEVVRQLSEAETTEVVRQLSEEENMEFVRQLLEEETVQVARQLPDEEFVQISAHKSAPRPNREMENFWRKEGQMLDLQYNNQAAAASEDERQQDQARVREENAQLKLVQEQMGKKLKEVEVQLKKVETSARAKEDVRAFAEQVKTQLYEELHVEKLRRGLV